MADTKIQLVITAKDKASATLKGLSKTTKKSFDTMKKAAVVATGAAVAAGATLTKFAVDASKSMDLQRGFIRSFGEDAEKNLNLLRTASKNTISDMDLMQTANRAALLGVTDSIEDLSGLMVTARLRGKEMGLSTTQAFNDIVTGIGRGSPLILDNLGIKIPDALKEMMEGMDEAEKAQALLQFAMEDGAQIAGELGGDIESASDKFAQLRASAANVAVQIGERVLPIIVKAIGAFQKFAGGLKAFVVGGDALNDMWRDLAKQFGVSEEKFEAVAQVLATIRQKVIEFTNQLVTFLKPIVEEIIRLIGDNWQGVLAAIATVIAAVVLPAIVQFVAGIAVIVGAITGLIAIGTVLFNAIRDNWEKIKSVVSAAFEVLKAAFQGFIEFARPIWEELVEIITLAWEVIVQVINEAIDVINVAIVPRIQEFLQFIRENQASILSVFRGVWMVIIGVIKVAISTIKGVLMIALNLIKGDWVGAWQSMKEAFGGIWDGIKSIAVGAFEGIVGVLKISINAVINLLNRGIEAINDRIDQARAIDVVGGLVPDINIPTIPRLQRGTKSFKGGPAIVGEAGPELVNLPRGAQVTPNEAVGGMNVQLNLEIKSTFGTAIDRRRVAEEVWAELRRLANSSNISFDQLK